MQMGPPLNPKPHLTLNPIPLLSQSHPKPMIHGGYLVGTHWVSKIFFKKTGKALQCHKAYGENCLVCLEGTLYPSTSIKVKRLHPLLKSERDLKNMPKDPLPPLYFRFLIAFV
jgi:hypothetical protein